MRLTRATAIAIAFGAATAFVAGQGQPPALSDTNQTGTRGQGVGGGAAIACGVVVK